MNSQKSLGLLVPLILFQTFASAGDPFQELYGWRIMDFSYRGLSSRRTAEGTKAFIPGNSVPLDVDVWKNRMILALPRLKNGIPATLATVPLNTGSKSAAPKLDPYPSWTYNREGNCKGVTSVFRVKVDSAGRLWVPDSGVVNVLNHQQQLCPAHLLIFDLNRDRILRRYKIPESNYTPGRSILSTIVVDLRNDTEDAFAYIADHAGFGLLVYDYRRDTSWRVNSNYFYPYPLHGLLTINSETILVMDGVTGLALSPVKDGDRVLFFHSLASLRESWVKVSLLQNESIANSKYQEFEVSEHRPSQSSGSAIDSNGVMFFGLLDRNAIACWNVNQPHQSKYIKEVHKDDVALQFPSGLKTDGDQNLWVLSSRLQSYILGTINNTDVNFRVLMVPIAQIGRRGMCAE